MTSALLLLLGCAHDPAPDDQETGLSTNKDGSTVNITPDWQACDVVEDCSMVSTSCDGCCGVGVVSAELGGEYDLERDQLCEGYRGAVCDCEAAAQHAECDDGLCILVLD